MMKIRIWAPEMSLFYSTHHHVTPSAGESTYSLIGFNSFPTLVTSTIAVTLDPMMKESTGALFRLDVGRDARGGGPLDTSFVDSVLAHCQQV